MKNITRWVKTVSVRTVFVRTVSVKTVSVRTVSVRTVSVFLLHISLLQDDQNIMWIQETVEVEQQESYDSLPNMVSIIIT